MKKEKINEISAKYYYFINYLLTNDINMDNYKGFFTDENFYEVFDCCMQCDEMYGLYSKEIHEKIDKILKYLLDNYDAEQFISFNDIESIYQKVKDNDNYELYNNEFMYKYDIVDSSLKNKAIIWNKSNINEAFHFDFMAFMSFDLINSDDIIKKNYIFNNEYLLFLKKFIKVYPDLVFDKKYKKLILNILKSNIEIDNLYGDSLIKNYINRNYNEEFDEKTNKQLYDKFIELNKELYIKVNNLSNKTINEETNKFTIETLEKIYYQSLLEKKIILNSNDKLDYNNSKLLNHLYNLIDYYISHNFINQEIKHNIISVMAKFKEKGIINLDEYNNYLIKLNSIESNENTYKINYITKKIGIKVFKIFINPLIIDECMETLDLDNKFIESLFSDEYEEKYLKHFIYDDNYSETVNRYLFEYPSIFSNKEIHSRVEKTLKSILDEYKKENLSSKYSYKKTLKKINKIYYGKR